MVRGLDQFTEHFRGFADHYILIGGGACDVQFERRDINFRATKDLDLVLIVEALTDEFVRHFWDFVRAGEYAVSEVDSRKCFYRFIKPAVDGYPKMLELFSRKPVTINVPTDVHITDIPTSEDVSSLSAILMDDDYYKFTLKNSEVVDGLRIANEYALICLKTKAFLNNRQRKAAGHEVRDIDILKHKNDVIRLILILSTNKRLSVPAIIKEDLLEYIRIVSDEPVDMKAVLKPMGMEIITLTQIMERLRAVFLE